MDNYKKEVQLSFYYTAERLHTIRDTASGIFKAVYYM